MNTLRRITRHAAKAVIAGTVTAAAALPLVGVLAAGAATLPANPPVPPTSYLFANGTGGASVPATFGAGFSGAGTVVLSAADASTLSGATVATFVATPVGSTTASSSVSFTSGSITGTSGATIVSTTISSSATTPTGYYNLAVTDTSGTITIPDAFYVATPPTITSITPTTLTVNSNGVAATVTGSGFESGATVTLESASGATLTNTLAYVNATTISGTISGTASGTYFVSVTNPDGGSATSTTVSVTVTGPSVTTFSPTAIAYNPSATSNTTTVTVNGTGFEAGAYVSIAGSANGLTPAPAGTVAGATTFVSATQLTFLLTVSSTSGQAYLTVHNPDGGTAMASGAIGIDEDSATVTPTVTSVTPALTLAVGGSAQLTITGTGFGLAGLSVANSDSVQFLANDGLPDGAVNCTTLTVISDTQISCLVGVGSGAISGAHALTVTTPTGNASAAFANALTVAGPTITSVSPATVPQNYTGSYAVTGTGFPTTATSVTTTGNQTASAESATLGTQSTYSLTGDTITNAGSSTGVAASTTVTNTGGSTGLTLSKATTAWLTGTNNVTISGSTTGNVTTDSTSSTSATLTVVSAAGIDAGMTVTGGNLNSGATYVVTSVSGTTVTLTATPSVVQTAGTGNVAVDFTETVTATQTPSAVVSVTSTAGILAGSTVSGGLTGTVSTVGTGVVTLTSRTTAPVAANTSLTFSNASSTFTGTVQSFAGTTPGASTTVTVTVNSSTSMTLTGASPSSLAGDMYVLTVNFGTAVVNAAVPEVVPPTITSIAYASSSISDVGKGATNQTVYVEGSGFLPGLTVSFPSTSGLSATVSSVTPNVITLLVSATSTASAAGVTVTNTTGGSATSPAIQVGAAPIITSVTPTGVVAGAAAVTVTIAGSGFVTGTTVTSSTPLLTIGAVTVVSANEITFTASGPTINGTANVGVTLSVTNPDGGVATDSSFAISTQPTVTGTYYVAPSSTNLEVFVNGTGFATSGMAVKSSSSDFTVTLAGVNSTGTQAVLLVTTDAAATQGTSSTITFTNPDGSTVSFPLNGGSAPKPVVKVAPKAIRMSAAVWTGKRTVVDILGVGFYGQPQITSNMGGTRVGVMRDNGKVLVIVVTVAKNVHVGVHTFTLRFANGQMTSVRYNQR